jgi:hypothetical protein
MQGLLKKRRKEWFDERLNPGDPEPELGAPGSIEQQLDMVEEGTLRGDQVLHEHNRPEPGDLRARRGEPLAVDELMALECYDLDLAEEYREGSEMTGDEHSSGLQGGESELASQPHIRSGMPGEQTQHENYFERREGLRRGRRGRR